MSKLPITVLISGTGTNLQALIDAQSTSSFQIVRVISNKKLAKGLQRATDANIPTSYHNILNYKAKHPTLNDNGEFQEAREQYDADLATLITKDRPSLVVCAGFMHILSAKAIEPLEQAGIRIINLHPAKWGAYDGSGAIERAHADFMAGEITETGVMIHYVIVKVDRGEKLLEEAIPLSHPLDDTVEALQDKIHRVEHQLIVKGTEKALAQLRESQKQ